MTEPRKYWKHCALDMWTNLEEVVNASPDNWTLFQEVLPDFELNELERELLTKCNNWKAIAQELAEVLKAESNFFVNCYKARHSEKVQKALAKFNKLKESAVSEND